MDIKAYFSKKADVINKALDSYLSDKEPEILNKAMRYSVFAGGKRLRPVLMMAACEAFGGKSEDVLPFACAMEMIHTYSLIHDDLPAMDNDDLRRGIPTNHKVFGEDMAILAGDGLLSLAFETMADALMKYSDRRYIKAFKAIAAAAGTRGMVAGQTVDVISEGKEVDSKTLEYIHINKTSAMIRGAIEAGAYIAGAKDEDVKKLALAGEKTGLAFQIQDDILDVESTQEVLGKPVMSDIKNEKKTFVSMYGVEYSKNKVAEYSEQAIGIIDSLDCDGEVLKAIVSYLTDRKY
ncbi:MAG: polyprenyl synthetase family protein [Lachnospiraceae bacterium]|nr:polyprenyl synthetase family protein [Lachnospiraceae bacterium]